jgi:hypothetical protein
MKSWILLDCFIFKKIFKKGAYIHDASFIHSASMPGKEQSRRANCASRNSMMARLLKRTVPQDTVDIESRQWKGRLGLNYGLQTLFSVKGTVS